MAKHQVVTVEDRLIAWREAEQAAAAAERAAAALGQAAADPRAGKLFLRAGELREQADRQFAALLRAVKLDEHGDTRGESANDQTGTQRAERGDSQVPSRLHMRQHSSGDLQRLRWPRWAPVELAQGGSLQTDQQLACVEQRWTVFPYCLFLYPMEIGELRQQQRPLAFKLMGIDGFQAHAPKAAQMLT